MFSVVDLDVVIKFSHTQSEQTQASHRFGEVSVLHVDHDVRTAVNKVIAQLLSNHSIRCILTFIFEPGNTYISLNIQDHQITHNFLTDGRLSVLMRE